MIQTQAWQDRCVRFQPWILRDPAAVLYFYIFIYLFALCVPCQCEPQWAPLSASPSPWKMAGRPDTKPQSQDLPPQGCTRGARRSFVAPRRPYPRLQSKWHSAWILLWVNIKKKLCATAHAVYGLKTRLAVKCLEGKTQRWGKGVVTSGCVSAVWLQWKRFNSVL